jgi:cobalamin biosynthesis Mg chelatase CobN
MNELIEKLNKYYSMSMFKDIEQRHQLNEEILELEKELKVYHEYYNGNLKIIKIVYEKDFNK